MPPDDDDPTMMRWNDDWTDEDSRFRDVGPKRCHCNHPHHIDRRYVDPQGSWLASQSIVCGVAGCFGLWLGFRIVLAGLDVLRAWAAH